MELSESSTKTEEDTPNFADYSIDDDGELEDSDNAATIHNNNANNANNSQASRQPRRSRRTYRGGFSTSICNLFQNQNSNKTDCCIFVCCGTLLSDRTHYLLTGERPTSLWKRLFLFLIVPLCISMIDKTDCCIFVCCGTLLSDRTHYLLTGERPTSWWKRLFLWLIVPLCISMIEAATVDDPSYSFWFTLIYFTFLLLWGKTKRVGRRQHIVGQLHELEERQGESVALTQQLSLHDSYRAHRLIGCYPMEEEVAEENRQQDLCGCLWNILAKMCCASWCSCWLQCCGMCAVGQEDREVVDRIVEKEATLIDFVSFQAFSEYHPKLENLRTSLNSNLWTHYSSVSKLSMQLLKSLGFTVLFLFIYAALDIDSNFTMENMFVLVATFFQAFFILYFVHWKWKKFDLSLDAVIKYFASGFLLATAMALIFEILLTLVVQFVLIFSLTIWFVNNYDGEDTTDDKAVTELVLDHPGWFIFYFFVSSFVLAALVEEIVKYFGYWMVIHPDLLGVDDVGSATSEASSEVTTSPVMEEDGGNQNDNVQDGVSGDVQQDQQQQQEQQESQGRRSLNSLGDGITVAMVAVALGFACCENLIYIFVYTPTNPGLEISTLLVRSIFPVHPLCAAIQSINVCQRDLEKENHIQLGRIIFPSVILHGTFDFVLMVMAFVEAYNAVKEGGESPSDEIQGEDAPFSWDLLWKELPSFLIGFALVVAGSIYYAVRSRAQRARLNAFEIRSGMALGSDTSLV
eukprot:CAMPEP_0185741080 /NCGR_PEP_ID=MMETSP1171-20130828/38766_1 /TAXON_ID=374046 /ORGANISM="Helicotheca tamensis, Strain CCMP826" /LENGTH=744 /DNA_ID=CAMNT_0028413023 /DNA_START=73 /DNA_END=2307 /DNA_ORIENTATION=-